MVDVLPELDVRPVLDDIQLSVLYAYIAFSGCECTHEAYVLGSLRDIDESAGARHLSCKSRNIDVAVHVDLRRSEACVVYAAAVVKVEHIGLLEDRVRVVCRACRDAGSRYSAHHAGLDAGRNLFDQALLVQYAGDIHRNADTQVDERVFLYFEYTPPAYYLFGTERYAFDFLELYLLVAAPRIDRIRQSFDEVLACVSGRAEYHVVDEGGWYRHLLRVDSSVFYDLIDLYHHDTAGIPGCGGHFQLLEMHRFLFERYVALFIGF